MTASSASFSSTHAVVGQRHRYTEGDEARDVVFDEQTKHAVRLGPQESAALDSVAQSADFEEAERTYIERLGGTARPGELANVLASLRDAGAITDGRSVDAVRAIVRRRWQEDHVRALVGALRRARLMPMFSDRIPATIASLAGELDAEAFARIPLLSRQDLRRAFPAGYYTDREAFQERVDKAQFAVGESSGLEGDARLTVFTDSASADEAALHALFVNRDVAPWNELRNAFLTSLHHLGLLCVADLPQMENRVFGDSLRLLPPEDPTLPTRAEINRIFRELRAHDARRLVASPTYLVHLTRRALEHGLQLPSIQVINTSYEYLSEIHRRYLAEAWSCPVYDTYRVEALPGQPLVQCEAGTYHANDRHFHIEVLRDGAPVAPGELGSLVVTTLRSAIPLIRYDIGDLVRTAVAPCTCGAVHTSIGRLAGHVDDAIALPSGGWVTVTDVDERLSPIPGIAFYKLVELAPRKFRLEVVPDATGDMGAIADAARPALATLLGDGASCDVRRVRALFPDPSGKFRLVVPLAGGARLRAAKPVASAAAFQID